MRGSSVNKNDWEMHTIPFRQSLFTYCIGKNHHPVRIMRPNGWCNFFILISWVGGNHQVVTILFQCPLKASYQGPEKTVLDRKGQQADNSRLARGQIAG